MGNRKDDDLGDDDETADIDTVSPTAVADDNVDPLASDVSTSLSGEGEGQSAFAARPSPPSPPSPPTARRPPPPSPSPSPPPPQPARAAPPQPVARPKAPAPWAPLVSRLQESGLMPADVGGVDAEDATVIRPPSSSASGSVPRPVSPGRPHAATGFAAPTANAAGPAGPAGVRPLGGAPKAEPLPDTIGRYRILRRLNTGDASDVLLAQSAGPGGFSKWVVIKRVLPELVDDERAVDMFLREARIAARLNHSAIVQTYELGEDIANGRRGYFIAMEYIDGLRLTDIAHKTWAQGKSLPLEVVTSALGDIALGLQYAHELSDDNGEAFGLVHRDVCPDNVLVTKTGDAKLVDFGVATMANLTRFTRDGELRIKIPYTAPEQLKSEEVDGRADLYSLGVSLYWLSTGTLPFTAKGSMQLMQQVTTLVPPPPSAHNATLPKRFDDLVMKLIAKVPAQRFASGEEVYEALLDAVPSSKNDVVGFWSDLQSPFNVTGTDAGAQPKAGVPAARLKRSMR